MIRTLFLPLTALLTLSLTACPSPILGMLGTGGFNAKDRSAGQGTLIVTNDESVKYTRCTIGTDEGINTFFASELLVSPNPSYLETNTNMLWAGPVEERTVNHCYAKCYLNPGTYVIRLERRVTVSTSVYYRQKVTVLADSVSTVPTSTVDRFYLE